MRRLSVLFVVVAFLTAPAGRAQALSYRQIVDRYRAAPDDGVEMMLSLNEAQRVAGIEQAATASGGATWSPDEIIAAAMMHTDAGFYFLSQREAGIPHLLIAERLLSRAMRVSPAHLVVGRRWYQIVESVVSRFGDKAGATAFAVRYRNAYKAAPERLKALDAYGRGIVAELDGCVKGEFLTITGLTEAGDNLVQKYFVPAAADLNMALTLEPDLLEAALHLGRVRMLENRDADAVRYFQRAETAKTRSVAYLAKLFLGSLAERASRWEDAETLYRDAAALFPSGQSAPLALSQLLDRRGRSADVERIVSVMLARTGAAVVEPWWLYFEEAGADDAVRVALLRAEFLK